MRVFAALLALKNPGEGFCCIGSLSKTRVGGFMLSVLALKNPGEGSC